MNNRKRPEHIGKPRVSKVKITEIVVDPNDPWKGEKKIKLTDVPRGK